MLKTEQGARILHLLSIRGNNSDAADRVRELLKAKLWAEETYKGLLLTLAENRWLHEERFPLIERLKGDALNEYEFMHLDALSLLVGVPLEPAVLIKEEHAGEKRWYAAYLDLVRLKALLAA
ncbi:hypothetical protein KBA73_03195 [Patescibacteria group bacterium]|jgi:hypothetical protein|nr:hypothetical protein [Patescibacteria group bacterium]